MVEEALRQHVVKIGTRLGRSEADVEPFLEILAEHWYDTMDSLAEITHEDLQALGIPLRFAKELAACAADPPAPQEKGKGKNGKGKGERGDREPKGKGKGERGDGYAPYEREEREPKGRGKAEGKGERGVKGESKGERKGDGKGERKGDSKGDRKGDVKGDRKGDGKGDRKGERGDRKGEKGKGKGSKGREDDFTHTIPLDGEDIDPEFPFKKRLAGESNRNLKHISDQTKAEVWLSGSPGGPEPMSLKIGCKDQSGLDKAAEMACDLVNTIFDEYHNWQDARDGTDAEDRGPPAIKSEKGGKGKSWGKGRGEEGKGKGKGKKGKGKEGKGKGKDGDRHRSYDDERPAKRPRY